jgi:hypothetical protein
MSTRTMTGNKRLIGMFMENLIELDDLPPELWPRKWRPKKPKRLALARAIKKAKENDFDVIVAPDGTVTFTNSKPTDGSPTSEKHNEWATDKLQ